MFTIEQIKTAHSKVKSGSDFPVYIKEIKKLGLIYYDTFVSDGHTDFFGVSDFKISSTAKYSTLSIAETCGGSAIAAISPVIKAEEKQISVALGSIFILNSIVLFVFPIIGHSLNLSQTQFGL